MWQMQSLAGKFLLSSPHMLDGNFARTITLMIEHDHQGAMGVVLNRPSLMPVKKAWQRYSDKPCSVDDVIYEGGPCPGPLLALHTNGDLSMATVCEGVQFTSDPDQMDVLVETGEQPMRLIVGYAGWGAAQLESELARSDWMFATATAADVFSDNPSLWARLAKPHLNKIGLPSVNPIAIPTDPSMN